MLFRSGAWVVQSLKGLTLGFCSGHDLTVCGFELCIWLHADSAEPAWDSLSLSLSAPRPGYLSLKINLKKKNLRRPSHYFSPLLTGLIHLPAFILALLQLSLHE